MTEIKHCPRCNTELPAAARFCPYCGPLDALPTAAAHVDGSGAVVQGDGSAAAGAGGIAVAGSVHGNIYTGPPPENPAEALSIYRRVLDQACGHLPLRGVDVGAADATSGQKPLGLAHVYVDLDTKTQVEVKEGEKEKRGRDRLALGERDTRPLSALEAVVANRCLVLLGDPGGGKTTFVNHLAHCLACGESLPGWPQAEVDLLPIVVILRDFARSLPDPLPNRAEPGHLWDFIVARLKAQNLELAAKPIGQTLEEGRALLLLDGLDEVPTVGQRLFVRDALIAFVNRYRDSRVLATCRVLSYQPPSSGGGPDLRLPGFPTFELALFTEDKINRFIAAWYAELARTNVVRTEESPGLARQLREAVRRPDLWRLAPNPLLLTVMALVHTHKGRLPDARALLYEDTVDILLWRWEQIKAGARAKAPRLRQLLLEAGRTDVDLKRVLAQLAYRVHAQVGDDDSETLADIGELRLQKSLAALKGGDSTWADRVIETIKLRAGLLLERAPEVFTFPHRTFQEYLAGAHLASLSGFARQACELGEQGAAWREVILLAVGRLVYRLEDTDKPLALVGELCPARAVDGGIAWYKAWLAGDVLLEVGVNRVEDSALGRDLLIRVRERLIALLAGGRLSPRQRAAAGDTLARLGDSRPGVGLREDGLPDVVWCEVPAGSFAMGSADDDGMAGDDEKPQHTVDDLPGFCISRYPITNAQFGAFVEAGSYRVRRYWREAEAAGLWQDGQLTCYTWLLEEQNVVKKVSKAPHDYGQPYNLPNHPVVGVSWYEALAFCRWLSEQLETEVCLPSEAEWEKAARGVDGRVYPWGNNPDPERANYSDTGIGTTSAVGCFPGGASSYGVEDASGNVWEWTRSHYRAYPYDAKDGREDLAAGGDVPRVLRGGAFVNEAGFVRAAYRNGYSPDFRYVNGGFRVVVVSPVSL